MANETRKTQPEKAKESSRGSRETVKDDSKEVGPAQPVSEEVHVGPDVDDLPDDKELKERQKANAERVKSMEGDLEEYEKAITKVREAVGVIPADDEITPRLLQLNNALNSIQRLLQTRVESAKRA